MNGPGYGGGVANNEWHWIITLQWQDAPSSTRIITAHGLYTATESMNRLDMFQELLTKTQEGTGAPATANVMFFALEPNTLTEA